jgi:hypothetical protein
MASYRKRKEREHYEKTGQWQPYSQLRKSLKITSKQKDPRSETSFPGLESLKALQRKDAPKQEDINQAIAEAQPSSLSLPRTIQLGGSQTSPDGGGVPQFLEPPVFPKGPMFSGGDGDGGSRRSGGAGGTLVIQAIVWESSTVMSAQYISVSGVVTGVPA